MAGRLLTRPALHTAGVYVALFMVTGVQMPFWPLWLADWGLTPEEVGLYTALGMAVRVVAGVAVPALADRLDRRRDTVIACTALTLVLYLAHLGIERKPVLLAATVAVGAAMAGVGPLSEALGVAAARAWGFAYAQVRGIGSMGFLVANLMVGAWIAASGSWVALWWIVVWLGALIALSVNHPGAHRVRGGARPDLREIGRLLMNPVFAIFMAATALIQASHAVIYALGSLHWRALGIGETEIGALWAAGVGVEIVFMTVFGTHAIERLGAVRAMAVAAFAGVVRWGAMMADPVGLWLWALQGLHALTFALSHLAMIAFISRAVPDRDAGAAQGAVGAMAMGGVMALQMALAAALYPALGGGTYGIGAVSAALGLGFCLWLARRWQGQKLAV